MSDKTTTPVLLKTKLQAALRTLLNASSKNAAAMYEIGFALGAGNPRGPAERNLEETSAAFVAAHAELDRALKNV